MPNWIKNVVKVKRLNLHDSDNLIKSITVLNSSEGTPMSSSYDRTIDFTKIIPEPMIESECPKKYIRTEHDHVSPDKERPWFNWYDWHCDHWGTKWNADGGYILVHKDSIEIVFNTAWSMPEPVIKTLAEHNNLFLEARWADEDLGSNCGGVKYDPITKEWTNIEYKDNYRFAKNLWDNY